MGFWTRHCVKVHCTVSKIKSNRSIFRTWCRYLYNCKKYNKVIWYFHLQVLKWSQSTANIIPIIFGLSLHSVDTKLQKNKTTKHKIVVFCSGSYILCWLHRCFLLIKLFHYDNPWLVAIVWWSDYEAQVLYW